MSDDAQKIGLVGALHSFARTRIADHHQDAPKAMPGHISKVLGNDLFEFTFDVISNYTLPVVTTSQAFSIYTRPPTQVGDKGYYVPNEISLSGESGDDGSTTGYHPRGNLSTGTFHPISDKRWEKRDPDKYYHTGGPKGYRARSKDEKTHMEIDPQNTINHLSSVDITNSAKQNINHLAQKIISMSATAINHTAIGQDITLLTQAGTPPAHPPVTDPNPPNGATTLSEPTTFDSGIGGAGGNINLYVQAAQKIINLVASGQNSNINLSSLLGGINLSTLSSLAGINLSSLQNIAMSALQGNISLSALSGIALSALGIGRTSEDGVTTYSGGASLNISSTAVEVSGDPSTPLGVVTKQMLDAAIAGVGGGGGTAGVTTFNGRSGVVVFLAADLTSVGGALLAGPAFTGIPSAPTATAGTNTTQLATTAFVTAAISAIGSTGVTSWNSRTGVVTLTSTDIITAGGAPLASPNFTGVPTAPTATPGTNTAQIANTAFVTAAIGSGFAPINSPSFTGVPLTPTAAPGTSTTQIASTAFVAAAITATGVSSWNARTGAVTLLIGDITGVGGAPLASPALTGTPTSPTATAGTNTNQIATTAFVTAAVAAGGGSSGVSSFNTRTGAVTLLTADITGAGGAPLASPTFTGVPAAPTATAGTNTTQLATTAFVTAAVAAATAGVASFNGRTGTVVLTTADITGAGGAPIASPTFTGSPNSVTPSPGDNSTLIATTAFVTAAVAAISTGVTSFNGRTGIVTFLAADITGVGGALLASPTFTGIPLAPTATAGTNTTQLATTAFVAAAITAGAYSLPTASTTVLGGVKIDGTTITIAAGVISSVGGAAPSSTNPLMDGVVAIGTSLLYARADHVHPIDTSRAPLNSPTFTGTVTIPAGASISGFAPLASPTFTGTPTLPTGTIATTQTAGNNTTAIATTAFVAISFAPLASPTFTGTPAAPTATAGTNTTQVATTAFVAAAVAAGGTPPNTNLVDNGDVWVDQSNAGTSLSVPNGGYWGVDRWYAYVTQSSKCTSGRNFGITPPAGFKYCFAVQSNSAYTPVAADQFGFFHNIEADMTGFLGWGAAGAQSVTLSFWVFSTLTGNFYGQVSNNGNTRSYVFTYSISSASTWEKKIVTIPGDTTGTWLTTGNGVGIGIGFDWGAGSTFRTASGSWGNGNFSSQTGGVFIISTLNARWGVTGIKLEAGSTATAFIFDPIPVRIARCQRYFCKSYNIGDVPGLATTNAAPQFQSANSVNGIMGPIYFPVRMRAGPTITTYSTGASNTSGVVTTNVGDLTVSVQNTGEGGFDAGYNSTTSINWVRFHWIADAHI